MMRIETERLILKPLTYVDAPSVFLWMSDPEVNRFMQYSLYSDVKQVEKWIVSLTPSDHVFGFFLKEGTLIGAGSIRYQEKTKAYNLGYNLNRDYWGKGFATEAAKALIGWAHDVLHAHRFVVEHAAENIASEKVTLKCGFVFSHYGEYSRLDGSKTFLSKCYRLELS